MIGVKAFFIRSKILIPANMTLAEKRALLIKEIQELPEEALDKFLNDIPLDKLLAIPLDKLLDILSKTENGVVDSDFEKYLQETTHKYKKVWEALS